MSDMASVFTTEGFLPFTLQLQWPTVPIKFPAFRDAIGKSVDHRTCNDLALLGRGQIDTAASQLSPNHPFRPPDEDLYFYTDKPEGDRKAARQVLGDADFGWDDNGNLHYPAGADPSPRWPQGKQPADFPEDYPCLEGRSLSPSAAQFIVAQPRPGRR